MKNMHVRWGMSVIGASVAALGLVSSASAGISASGVKCVGTTPANAAMISYDNGGAANTHSTNVAFALCPLEVDHTIGATSQFDVSVQDAHGSRGFLCNGYVLDADGDLIGQTPNITTGTTETGTRITRSAAVTVSSVVTNSYVLGCDIPDADIGGSIIWTARVD